MDNWQTLQNKRILIDNGSSQIRIGNASEVQPLLTWDNLIGVDRKTGNTLVGNQLDNQLEEQQLIYLKPHVRGVLVDVENQVYIWEKILEQMMDQEMENFQSHSLTISYHPGAPMKVTQRIFELALEYFQFDAVYPALCQEMLYISSLKEQLQRQQTNQFTLIVESSHSATYVVPIFNNEVVKHAIKRLDVGGKLLTKQIQQNISNRHLDLTKEYRLCKQIKEEMCYVSIDYQMNIKKPKNSHLRYFVLPDYDLQMKGEMTYQLDKSKNQQSLKMDKEQFQIPEVLFNPSDICLMQQGIIQTTMESLKELNPDLQNYFLENIILSGGNTNFQNFEERYKNELQQNVPNYMTPYTTCNQNINTYNGMYEFNNQKQFADNFISKAEYNERGFQQIFKAHIF